MVRRCAVSTCSESDLTLLSHRFPKVHKLAEEWRNALHLANITSLELQRRYVVCTRHFPASAYRNEISNSLNSNAVPNLSINKDNERIKTTKPETKKKIVTPIRCHKLPETVQRKYVLQPPAPKVRILDQIVTEMHLENEEEDLFEKEGETLGNFEHVGYLVPEEMSPLAENQEEDEELPEPESSNHVIIPHVTFQNQETQTDQIPEPTPPQLPETSTNESKDEKLIGILYPEFKNHTRVQLIEMLAEKNQKIEALESKLAKLELAMREML